MQTIDNSLASGKGTPRAPRWIIRGQAGEPFPFGADGWAIVLGFALQGWAAMRDGDAVRVWPADMQEGIA